MSNLQIERSYTFQVARKFVLEENHRCPNHLEEAFHDASNSQAESNSFSSSLVDRMYVCLEVPRPSYN